MPLLTILGITGGAGGGGGPSWDPSELNGLVAAYECWDATSWFGGPVVFAQGGAELVPKSSGYWTEIANGNAIGTIADKAGLLNAGVSWGTFEAMCAEHGGGVSIPLDTTTGWTLGANWSIDTMAETLDGAGTSSDYATYTVPSSYVVDNGWYLVQFRLTFGASDRLGVTLGNTAGSVDTNLGGALTDGYAHMLIKANGNDEISFESGLINFAGEIYDITIQAIPGNHISLPAEANASTDGNGVRVPECNNNNVYGYTEYDVTCPADIAMFVMFDPRETTQTEPRPGIFGISNDLSSDDAIFFGGQVADEAAAFTPSVWIEDTGYEELYGAASTDNTVNVLEVVYDMADESYEVWEADSSVATGTATKNPVWNASTNRISMFTQPLGSPTSLEFQGTIYAAYIYQGARDADLFSHVNSNTGENF